MVKRGRDISNLHLTVYVDGKLRLKKFTWLCGVCGAEYISRSDARACEGLHEVSSKLSEFPQLRKFKHELVLAREVTRELVGGG